MVRVLVVIAFGLPLLVAADEAKPVELNEAAKAFRVAWASQYEWKEDEVNTVSLDFSYEGHAVDAEKRRTEYGGRGQIVIVDGEVVRHHFAATNKSGQGRVRGLLDWMVGRFVRKPFAEAFKEAKFTGPTKSPAGGVRVGMGPLGYFIKDDQFIAREESHGTAQKPIKVRVELTPKAMGGGYGVLAERYSYKQNAYVVSRTRKLSLRGGEGPPMPKSCSTGWAWGSTSGGLTVRLDKPVVNDPQSIVIDAAARDLLRKAWERRYTLPGDFVVEGKFERKLGKRLKRVGWAEGLDGEFVVRDGKPAITVTTKRVRNDGWRKRLENTCTTHFNWMLAFLSGRPFDEEFAGCGFRGRADGDTMIVQVYGHDGYMAWRLKDDALDGFINHEDATWWEFKTRKAKDGRLQIVRITHEADKTKFKLNWRWGKVKGVPFLRGFEVLVTPATSDWGNNYGTVEYNLSKLRRPKN